MRKPPDAELECELARAWLAATRQGRWRLSVQTRAALCLLGGEASPWEALIASSFARSGGRLRWHG
ncbi:hypothetical protein MARPU_04315 [Marichromatium purpuratum 984]|uniref:Uncharacterized protein n=1 Tax=Marichromatium purpuratum 984 TaxID=765910 RepID=W0E8J1_MARPU|nr:hypothetical protein [Marichromatium purpuratum]AHF05376.1 hypothetical protein MARPU_04315 [Marichromatium purpuratum 984]